MKSKTNDNERLFERVGNNGAADPAWESLYRVGGVAALFAAVLVLGEIVIFALYPQPGTVDGWFALFQSNTLIGLLDFWALEVPMYVLFAMVFLALYATLGKAGGGWTAIAAVLAIMGSGVFLATNNPASMLSLSNQYAAAATDAQRSMLLAAGQALLANTGQRVVDGFNAGLFLVSVAGLMVSLIMLRSNVFGRLIASVGILAHALSLADYLRGALVPSNPVAALLMILPNALFLSVWFALLGERLYRAGGLQGTGLLTGGSASGQA